uniref:FBD domain-containing protein n=1 Tax=Steinernema glaseri TaxID=37863 RepID=A0A1I7ZSH4_9BILA
MDRIPFAFWTHLCHISLSSDVTEAKELSGPFGELSQIAFHHMLQYVTVVEEGIEKLSYLHYWCTDREERGHQEIERISKKFVRTLTINFKDTKPEIVSRKLIQRFPHAIPNFQFFCSSISEAWVDFACSLKRFSQVLITKKLDDRSVGLLQRVIDTRKLLVFTVCEKACEGGILATLKSLLCQDQFREVEVRSSSRRPWESGVVSELLQFWSQNSEKLKGKRLVLERKCEGGVQQLEKFLIYSGSSSFGILRRMTVFMARYFLLQQTLKVCSREECDVIKKEYRHNYRRFHKPSCVYKFEEGEGSERRRLYISFECATARERRSARPKLPASHKGLDDLGLMRATSWLEVLFA